MSAKFFCTFSFFAFSISAFPQQSRNGLDAMVRYDPISLTSYIKNNVPNLSGEKNTLMYFMANPVSNRSACAPACIGLNLVPNPGFEMVNPCPVNDCSCVLPNASFWMCPTGASPNLFNSCSPAGGGCSLNVPDNFCGNQLAHGGNGYAGFATFGGVGADYREYVETPLSTTLQTGQTYYVEFYLNMPDYCIQYSTNNIGAYFSVDSVSNFSTTHIPVTPQVNTATVITDTANWVKVCGEFVASDTFRYMTIGNFFDDAGTTEIITNGAAPYNDAYYYIDDITVAKVGSTFLQVNLGNDTSICSGQNVLLNAGNIPLATYLWSDNSSAQTITVNSFGIYSVTVTDTSGCSSIDSIAINPKIITLNISSVNTSCGSSNGSAAVNANAGTSPYTYNWDNGGIDSTITNLAAGTYRVTVTDATGCTLTDSVIVNSSGGTNVNINADKTVMCPADTTTICAPAGFVSYVWNTGDTAVCIFTQLAGNYYVTVTDAGSCTATSNHIAITVHTSPPVSISVNGDTLTAYNAVTYQWFLNGNPIAGATFQNYIAFQPGSYTVEITDTNGCGAFSTAVIITDIQDLGNDNELSIYPNPSEVGNWQLAVGNNLIGGRLEIFNAEGRLVLMSNIEGRVSNIELNAAGGIYLLRICSEKITVTRKLIRL